MPKLRPIAHHHRVHFVDRAQLHGALLDERQRDAIKVAARPIPHIDSDAGRAEPFLTAASITAIQEGPTYWEGGGDPFVAIDAGLLACE